MNVPFTAIHGSIRWSLSRFTTEDEIDYVIEKLPAIIEKVTSICNSVYESEKMLRFYNNNNNVIDTLNDFIIGVVDIVVEGISTVVNHEDIAETLQKNIEEVEERINRDSPSSIVWKAKFVKEKYKKEVNSMTMSLVDDISN